MSRAQASTHPDLDALRPSAAVTAPPPRRPWLPRLTITVVVLGALGAAYAVLRPLLFPPRAVTLALVRPAEAGDDRPRPGTYVQAAGWVEADPFPVTVRPLVRGIVERLAVIEGSKVTAGTTEIAILRNAEHENALVLARAGLGLALAETARAATALSVANSLLEQKLDLRAAVAQRKGELATTRAEIDRATARRKVAEASLVKAEVDLTAQRELAEAGSATPTALASAKANVTEAEENVRAVRFDEVRLVAELARITDLLELAREAVREPRDLEGRVAEAESEHAHAQAAEASAQARLDVAERNVALLTINAPVSGVVMRLEAAPGALVGPAGEFKGAGEGVGSTGLLNRLTGTICSIYDPAKLQVRVDVPYADLPGITSGTEVELEAKAIPGKRFRGVVTRLQREADITQAKLQVKVRVTDPDPRLRPEMICTARFLVKAQPGRSKGSGANAFRLLVPTAALRGDAVFVFDPTGGGTARRVAVRVIRTDGEWTEVEGDLGLSSKVILDDVQDDESVKEKR